MIYYNVVTFVTLSFADQRCEAANRKYSSNWNACGDILVCRVGRTDFDSC
jgi:hypothetical protein